jgi:hypothetical protein
LKKLSIKHRNWLIYRTKKAAKNLARKKATRREPGRLRIITCSDRAAGGLYADAGGRLIAVTGPGFMPPVLCFDREYASTLEFFGQLRRRTEMQHRGTRQLPRSKRKGRITKIKHHLDFEKLEHISAGAALILAAEFDRSSRRFGTPPATFEVERWNEYVASTLYQLGFFDILHFKQVISVYPTEAGSTARKQMVRIGAYEPDLHHSISRSI